MTFTLSSIFLCITFVLAVFIYKAHTSTFEGKTEEEVARMSRLVTELREITGISQADAKILAKKHKTLEGAIEAFYSDPGMQSRASMGSYSSNGKSGGGSSSVKNQEKKLGEIWERFKDETNSRLITIEGTMELCQELDIDPESDVVLFCLASDLGSKTTGEWEKGPFVSGWASMPGNIDSIEGMKARLPELRRQLYSDSVYFKKVYMHTFDLAKAEGSRTLGLETALSLWPIFVRPALESSPSALSHIPSGSPPNTRSSDSPQFTSKHFDQWIEFQTKKNKAVSKDTWNLFVDFMRSIDSEFKQYDEAAAWPSTIDDFVDYVRSQ